MFLLIVPVLPAETWSSERPAELPKPPGSWTPRRMSFTASATSLGITCSQLLGYSLSTFPLLFKISVTGRFSQLRPRAANVAYAPAIDSGSVSVTPRVNGAKTCSSGTLIPIFLARVTGSHRPVRSSSWAKNVFTDCCVPVYRSNVPDPVEFSGLQMSTQINSPNEVFLPVSDFKRCDGNIKGTDIWSPENSTGSGTFDLYTGTQQSVNTFFAQLELRTGLCEPVTLARKMGINVPDEQVFAPFTLGVTDTDPLSMAGAYATFA